MASDEYLLRVAFTGQGMLLSVCSHLNKESTKVPCIITQLMNIADYRLQNVTPTKCSQLILQEVSLAN